MRKILLVPPFILYAVGLATLFAGEGFDFLLWLTAGTLVMLALYPVAFNMKETNTPILQIFAGLVLFFILFTAASYIDLAQYGIDRTSAFILAPIAGLAIVAIIMFTKGK